MNKVIAVFFTISSHTLFAQDGVSQIIENQGFSLDSFLRGIL